MDGFSRFTRLIPCAHANAAVVVQGLLEWFALFGIANQFISDRGSHFNNEVLELLQQRLMIQHHFTAAYAPWSNGQVERVNREIREILSAMISETRLDAESWIELLPVVNFAINNSPSRRLHGHAPVEAFVGHAPTSPLDVIFRPAASEFSTISVDSDTFKAKIQQLQDALFDIHSNIQSVAPRKRQPRKGATVIDFDIGDYVLTARTTLRDKDKTRTPWQGPARVTAKVNDRTFVVTNLLNNTTSEVHADHIKRFANKDFTVTTQLRDFIAHGGALALVSKIIGHRRKGTQWELHVCWEGYLDSDATWEVLPSLMHDVPVMTRRYANSIDNETQRKELLAEVKRLGRGSSRRREVSRAQRTTDSKI